MANGQRQSKNYEWNEHDSIGFGAFCQVFKGKRKGTDQEVAVKVCPLRKTQADGQKGYIEDIHILQRLNSPHITKYFADEEVEVDGPDKQVAIVMELASGNLEGELKKEENLHGLPKEVWLVLVDNCVDALEYLHKRKLSHRDVKPANILMFKNSVEPKLVFKFCDFGLSRLLNDKSQYMSTVLGTPAYMHPRMFEAITSNKTKISYKQDDVDIWATACSFFEAATGIRPFVTKNLESDIAMNELFKQRPPNTVYAYFDIQTQMYIYKPDMPMQHCSYKESFRSILSKYFQMAFSNEEAFLEMEKFSALSREMIAIKEHEFFCLNSLLVETYCDTTLAHYLPKKTFQQALEEINNSERKADSDGGLKLLKLFLQEASAAVTFNKQYEEPFLGAIIPPDLFEECYSNRAATLHEVPNGIKLQIEVAESIAIEKRDCTFLQFAVQEKIPSLVAYLRSHSKSSPNADTASHGMLLITAIKEQNYGAASALLADGAPLNAVDENGEFALSHAASSGDVDLVKLLVLCGAPLGSRNKQDMTPLHIACGEGHNEIAEYLLESGADIDIKSQKRCTPIMMAATKGKREVAEMLISRGADINFSSQDDGRTALRDAAFYGHPELVTLLVENGAEINPKRRSVYTAIHHACQQGYLEIVAYLIDKGAKINAVVDRSTPLMLASLYGREDVARLLLEKGADVNVVIPDDGRTAVRDAAYRGHYSIVVLLTEHGANIDAIEPGQLTPLQCAAMGGYTAIVAYLLDKGVDINCVAEKRYTALMLASRDGRRAAVELLISRGADVNVIIEENRETALGEAIRKGHLSIVKLLVEHGAKMDSEGSDQATPLHRAAQEGYTEIAKYLLDKGANVNALDELGATPLMQAAASGKLEMATTLIDRGADVNAVAADGESALQDAADSGNLDLVKLLVEKGAKVDSVNSDKLTPLHYACEKGYAQVAAYLLEKGANIEALDELSSTPLMLAVLNAQEEMAEFLIERGANIQAKRNDGATALHNAAENGSLHLVKRLVESGAQVNSGNKKKLTPLHYACEKGYIQIVSYLLEKGAKVDATTKDGETPLALADKNGRDDIVSLLQEQIGTPQALSERRTSWRDWLFGFKPSF